MTKEEISIGLSEIITDSAGKYFVGIKREVEYEDFLAFLYFKTNNAIFLVKEEIDEKLSID